MFKRNAGLPKSCKIFSIIFSACSLLQKIEIYFQIYQNWSEDAEKSKFFIWKNCISTLKKFFRTHRRNNSSEQNMNFIFKVSVASKVALLKWRFDQQAQSNWESIISPGTVNGALEDVVFFWTDFWKQLKYINQPVSFQK